MKRFKYKAKKGPSEVSEGVLLAQSQDEAIDLINEMGLVPVQIEEEAEVQRAEASAAAAPQKTSGEKVPAHVITLFYRHFSRFIKSGIPLLPSLVIVSEQTEHELFKAVLESAKGRVREGLALSKALAPYPHIFPPFDIAMIEAGESMGRMDQSLGRIAHHRKAQEVLISKIRMALAYPILVVTLAIAALIFMMTYVIPKFSRFFLDLGQELPLPTKLLIEASFWLQSAWPYMVIGLAVLALYFRQALKSEKQKGHWHKVFLRIPKFGNLILMSQLARLCRTLELLIKSGISLLRALRIALPVLTNEEVKKEFESCYHGVEHGGALSEALRKSKLTPLFVVHLIKIGEESGKLDESFGDIADWYEQEVDESIKMMTQLLEPLVILFVGLLLGFMAIAILLPVFSMNAVIS